MKIIKLSVFGVLLAATTLFISCGGGNDPVAMAKEYIKSYYVDYDYQKFLEPFMQEGKELSPAEVEYYDSQREIAKSLKFTIRYDESSTTIDEATARVYFDIASEIDPSYNDNVVVRLDKNKHNGKWLVTYFVSKEFKTADHKFTDYYEKGLEASENGNFRQAIDLYQKAIIANPNHIMVSSIYHDIGTAYLNMKDYDRAAMNFEIANEGELKYAKSYYSAGRAYAEMKEYERAVDSFKKAIELEPDNDRAYAGIGLAYLDMENYDQATEYFKEAARRGNEGAQNMLRKNGIEW